MASNYTGLGVQLMTTGEKAGTWGTLTNTNWNIIEQISGGYIGVAITSTPTTLAVSDGSTGAALAHRVIEFTGSIGEATIVTIPLDVQTFYIIKNSSSGAYTVQFKYVTGSGGTVTWSATDKGTKIVYATANDGTNPDIVDATSAFVTASSTTTLTNKTLTAPVFADGGFIADANGAEALVFGAASTAVNELKITNAATGSGPILSAVSTSATDSNIDINVTPLGTGNVNLLADTVQCGDLNAAVTVTSNGTGDLILNTNNGSSSSDITITDAADGDIDFTCNGTGNVVFNDAAYAPETSLVDGSTIAWDVQDKPITKVTLTANRIVGLPTNGQAGQFISLLVIQDAGGTNTLTWNAAFEFPSETAPTLTATGDLADLFVFRYHNAKWLQVGATLALTVA
jgi:hypothetical protein